MTNETPTDSEARDIEAAVALSEEMFSLRKKIPEDMIQDIEAMDVEQLHERIVQSERAQFEAKMAKKADADVLLYKEKLRDASAPYSDVVKTQKAIASYAAALLEKNGK